MTVTATANSGSQSRLTWALLLVGACGRVSAALTLDRVLQSSLDHFPAIQAAVYEVGRAVFPDTAKPGPDGRPGVSLAWFATLYQLLLGQERGPRFGSFAAIYGVPETRALIAAALARTDG